VTDPIQIYLHIGIPKTGTSALREACETGRGELARQGICYPRTPGLRNHLLLAVYASDHARTLPVLRRMVARHAARDGLGDVPLVEPSADVGPGKTPEQVGALFDDEAYLGFRQSFPELLRGEILQSGCQKVVLSNEQLSSQLKSANEIRRIADLLRPISTDIRVVVYLRRQDELALSLYSTSIRAGAVLPELTVQQALENYDYAVMLEPWAKVFGKQALIVKVYERSRLKDGDLVSDFFSIVGYKPVASVKAPSRSNTSLDALSLAFLREFNRHVPEFVDSSYNPLRSGIGSALEAISNGSNPKNWRGRPLREVVERFAESNANVAREYLDIEDGKLFSDSPVAEYDEEPELSADKAIEIAAQLWIRKQEEILRLRKRVESLLQKSARLEQQLEKESASSRTVSKTGGNK
jgi:hypothetical protein